MAWMVYIYMFKYTYTHVYVYIDVCRCRYIHIYIYVCRYRYLRTWQRLQIDFRRDAAQTRQLGLLQPHGRLDEAALAPGRTLELTLSMGFPELPNALN